MVGSGFHSSLAFLDFLKVHPAGISAFAKRRRRNGLLTLRSRHHPFEANDQKEINLSARQGRELTNIATTCYPFSSKPHDYLLKNTYFYPDARSGSPGPCIDKMAATLRQHLHDLSAPAKCVNTKQVVTGGPPFGFGSTVTSWVRVSSHACTHFPKFVDLSIFIAKQPLVYALDHNLSFWSPNLGAYKDLYTHSTRARCNQTSTACFFEPLSRCETTQIEGCFVSDKKRALKLGDTRKCIKLIHSTDTEVQA
jgi:hypothetical protein